MQVRSQRDAWRAGSAARGSGAESHPCNKNRTDIREPFRLDRRIDWSRRTETDAGGTERKGLHRQHHQINPERNAHSNSSARVVQPSFCCMWAR